MTEREQLVRSGSAIHDVFDNQFPTLTNQIIRNMQRVSMVGDKWPPVLLVLAGAALAFTAVAIKVGFLGEKAMLILWPGEFIALVLAGAGLMLFGALFSLYQARSLRKIIKAQQVIGTELLNKQIDIEKDLLTGKHKQQGQLILLPAKKLKRLRRC